MQSKLSIESVAEMVQRPIAELAPYRVLAGPAYVLLKRNEKLVAVKRALDFFTPAEIEKLGAYESLYFPNFPEEAGQFLQAARVLREYFKNGASDAAPFEISDFCWKALRPLFTAERELDLSLAVLAAEELCAPIDGETLMSARDQNALAFERAVQCASLAVMLAACLGYCEWTFLNRLRLRVFLRTMNGIEMDDGTGEVGELIALSQALVRESVAGKIHLANGGTKAALKLSRRFDREVGHA